MRKNGKKGMEQDYDEFFNYWFKQLESITEWGDFTFLKIKKWAPLVFYKDTFMAISWEREKPAKWEDDVHQDLYGIRRLYDKEMERLAKLNKNKKEVKVDEREEVQKESTPKTT
jgi:hypothetical protein